MNILKNRNDVITYTVDKNVNNNLYISVQNGEVIVRAPWYLNSNQIQDIVEEKRRWIVAKIKEYEEEKQKKYSKNKSVKILGENFNLKISYINIRTPEVNVKEKDIHINIPNRYKSMDIEEILKVIIEKMYNVIAEQEIDSIMEKTRILLGISPEDYEIIGMDDILAKCLEGKKIIINPNIVMYKKEVIEYVILHEFCHLKYKNHTKSLYDMIKKYMPDYENYANEIKKLQY